MIRSIFIAALLAGPTLVFAQGKTQSQDPAAQAVNMTERMTEHLSLDAEQQVTVLAIHQVFTKEAHRIRTDKALSGEEKSAELQQAVQARKTSLDQVLSPEQQEKMPARSAEGIGRQGRKPGMPSGMREQAERGPEGAEARLTRLTERLSLNETQVTAIRQLDMERQQAGQQAARAQRTEHEAAMQNILTEEQFTQWKSLHNERGGRRQKQAKQAPAPETR